jgi:CDP-diacylglycerol---glycerol-3-phosphate 3-phosphatidyltransferase
MNNRYKRYLWESLPNHLTLFRICVVPVLFVLYPIDIFAVKFFCGVLFAVASITDWLDGYIARKYKMESKLGEILDPLADKMLTGGALILVAAENNLWVIVAGMLLCREIAISGVRLIACQHDFFVPVHISGKLKTVFLDIALTCLLVNEPVFGWPFRPVGMICIWLSLFFSYFSFYFYFKDFWKKMEL